MNVFVEEDKEATIDCTTWPGVKINDNTEVGAMLAALPDEK